MINVASSILAPKGCTARIKIGAAFAQYFENYVPGRTQSSAMIYSRYTINTQHGISLWNQGRLEVGTLLGILANTIPSLFYMLIRIYSDKNLLGNIRNELETTAVLNCTETSKKILILKMRKNCLLLQSTFQEILRFHAKGASARYVREDTMLDNRYLLKKGTIIQIPQAVMHFDSATWGPDAQQFKPARFLSKSTDPKKPLKPGADMQFKSFQGTFQAEKESEPKPNPVGYRPFGGGASLCPGRHFVTLEALSLTAFMVLQFDIEPVDGEWSIPPQKQESLATNVFPPKHDVKVRIRRRKGVGEINWGFDMI